MLLIAYELTRPTRVSMTLEKGYRTLGRRVGQKGGRRKYGGHEGKGHKGVTFIKGWTEGRIT